MKTLALETAPDYHKHYIGLAPDAPLTEILPDGGIDLYINQFKDLNGIGTKVYAEDKWTIQEIVQHCIDTERIFAARALRILREDQTNLPGYDHDAFVKSSRANEIPLEDLIEEYKLLRKSTVYLFKNLTKEELKRTGTASGLEISVAAIGYVLIGHPIHHFEVIKERYFPL